MRTATLVDAKTHLSELVDDAEYKGRRTVISRHGKPAAVLVPVSVGAPAKAPRRMAQSEVDAMRAELAAYDRPGHSAVEDTVDGRR